MGLLYFWILKTRYLTGQPNDYLTFGLFKSKSNRPRTFNHSQWKNSVVPTMLSGYLFHQVQFKKRMCDLKTLVVAYSYPVAAMPTSLQIFAPSSPQHFSSMFTPFTTKQYQPLTYISSSTYCMKPSLTKPANTDGLTPNWKSTTPHTLP